MQKSDIQIIEMAHSFITNRLAFKFNYRHNIFMFDEDAKKAQSLLIALQTSLGYVSLSLNEKIRFKPDLC